MEVKYKKVGIEIIKVAPNEPAANLPFMGLSDDGPKI